VADAARCCQGVAGSGREWQKVAESGRKVAEVGRDWQTLAEL